MEREYLADLSTGGNPKVRIDGELYPLRLDMDFADILRYCDLSNRIKELGRRSEDLTEQEEAELSDALRRSVAAILDAPAEVQQKLTDMHCGVIVSAFASQVTEKVRPFVNGSSVSSPDSSDSTGARRKTGSG